MPSLPANTPLHAFTRIRLGLLLHAFTRIRLGGGSADSRSIGESDGTARVRWWEKPFAGSCAARDGGRNLDLLLFLSSDVCCSLHRSNRSALFSFFLQKQPLESICPLRYPELGFNRCIIISVSRHSRFRAVASSGRSFIFFISNPNPKPDPIPEILDPDAFNIWFCPGESEEGAASVLPFSQSKRLQKIMLDNCHLQKKVQNQLDILNV
ncbi:hypothetical protein LXL04_037556 [Taraxacum kok-saghyz]